VGGIVGDVTEPPKRLVLADDLMPANHKNLFQNYFRDSLVNILKPVQKMFGV